MLIIAVVRIRILIGTTVVRIRILIGTTVVRIATVIVNWQFQKAFSKKALLSLNQLATQLLQNGMDNGKIGSHSVPPSLHSKYQPMPEITISAWHHKTALQPESKQGIRTGLHQTHCLKKLKQWNCPVSLSTPSEITRLRSGPSWLDQGLCHPHLQKGG